MGTAETKLDFDKFDRNTSLTGADYAATHTAYPEQKTALFIGVSDTLNKPKLSLIPK